MPTKRRGDDRFRLAVDASPAAMVMVDANGLIEFANAETERMFGYAVFELIGQSIDILVPTRSREAHAGLRGGFFANPSARPMGAGRDLYGTHKDGREFPVEIALTPIEAESGPIALATIVDITARAPVGGGARPARVRPRNRQRAPDPIRLCRLARSAGAPAQDRHLRRSPRSRRLRGPIRTTSRAPSSVITELRRPRATHGRRTFSPFRG